ncbi:MAG: hypothetical protein V2A74_06275 [bacterium]
MSSQLFLLLRAKYKIADNYLIGVKEHLLIHLFVFLGIVAVLVAGGLAFFYALFEYLMDQEPFGPPLMDRLVSMVMMAFFSMLIFSNLVITLSTNYISKEMEFLMAQPLSRFHLFFAKLLEAAVYSSWAFAILSFPLFAAFGMSRNVGALFYPLVALLLIPFLLIPAAIGAVLTLLVSAYFPARRSLRLSVGLAGVAIMGTVGLVRMMGLRQVFQSTSFEEFGQIMSFLRLGSLPLLPNYWFSQGLLALSQKEYLQYGYWFLVLLSTALFGFQICAWLVPGLYYRGWCLSRETAGSRQTQRSSAIFDRFDLLLRAFSQPIRALISKDVKTFWRDPAQWGQLIILFGLLFIYIANLRGAAMQAGNFNIFLPRWQLLLSFFNMGATCFILSILTTRFVYPLLSLEGKQFWVIGLAPFPREKLIWEKYWLCWFTTFALSETLMLFSNWVLKVEPFMMWLSVGTILLMSFALTSLAVGLGAISPNFKEDNPARIANGLGGTLNVILSLIFIGGITAAEVYPTFLRATRPDVFLQHRALLVSGAISAICVLSIVTIFVPMRIGLRSWRRMEF